MLSRRRLLPRLFSLIVMFSMGHAMAEIENFKLEDKYFRNDQLENVYNIAPCCDQMTEIR